MDCDDEYRLTIYPLQKYWQFFGAIYLEYLSSILIMLYIWIQTYDKAYISN